MRIKTFLQENRYSLLYVLLFTALPLLCSSTLIWWTYGHETEMRAWLWPQWAIAFLLAVPAMGMALVPTTFMALLAGFFLGAWAIPPMILSYTAASILSFFLAKVVDRGHFTSSLKQTPKAQQLLAGLQQQQLRIAFYAKLSPVLPFAVSNFLLSIGGASLRDFVLGSLGGMLPRTLLSIGLGASAHQLRQALEQGSSSYALLLIALLVVAAVWGLYRAMRKATKGPGATN